MYEMTAEISTSDANKSLVKGCVFTKIPHIINKKKNTPNGKYTIFTSCPSFGHMFRRVLNVNLNRH